MSVIRGEIREIRTYETTERAKYYEYDIFTISNQKLYRTPTNCQYTFLSQSRPKRRFARLHVETESQPGEPRSEQNVLIYT